MEEILHHLRLVVYPNNYKALCIPGGWGWDFCIHRTTKIAGSTSDKLVTPIRSKAAW